MAVPQQRKSRSRSRMRRASNSKMTAPAKAYCSKCGSPRWPHRACPTCGFFNDKLGVVIDTGFEAEDQDDHAGHDH